MSVVILAPKPTVAEEVQSSIMATLEKAVTAAKNGDLTSVVIIATHPDGQWSDWHSLTDHMSETIGKLEIAKHRRIKNVLDQEE